MIVFGAGRTGITYLGISTVNPYLEINHPLLTYIPQELVKLANILAARAKEVNFSQTCTEVRGIPELDMLLTGAYTAAPLLHHTAEHVLPISLPRIMYEYERGAAQGGGVHSHGVSIAGAGRARDCFLFGSGHLLQKPMSLAHSSHSPCGKETATDI